MKRVFLIVLDSFGIGAMPDCECFGDSPEVNTFKSCFDTGKLEIPNMAKLGIFNTDGVNFGKKCSEPCGIYGRLAEKSMGKDTTVGHWEIAGIVSHSPLPTYKNGFPPEIINAFTKAAGRGILCNKPYSGTEVIRDYGEEHIKTGKLIVYTSADSVFQIAAHEDIVPTEQLYDYCKTARKILTGANGVGRVIARPFTGTAPDFIRTPNRHDFSLEPPADTMLDFIKYDGLDVISIGKIYDIFAGRGITKSILTRNNSEGIDAAINMLKENFTGLCFINLVDFDMVYGHRNNVQGYTKALNSFDKSLKAFMSDMKNDDFLIITADHGCDPGWSQSTDHSREYVPVLMYSKDIIPNNLGTSVGFGRIGATVCKLLNVKNTINDLPLI